MASQLHGSLTVLSSPAVRVRGLGRSFGAGSQVLDDLDLDIAPGEFVALIGRSGSGKSTLLRALAGLDQEVTGELTVDGAVAIAFQEPRLVPWKRVSDNVSLGLRTADPQASAAAALAEVGLTGRAQAWPLTLSGGEAQRASLARALVREPSLLLLDEPFSALDALTTIAMHRLVLSLWENHRPAVLLVTHDVDEALALADRVVVLTSGRISYSCQVSRGPAARPQPVRPQRTENAPAHRARRRHGRKDMRNVATTTRADWRTPRPDGPARQCRNRCRRAARARRGSMLVIGVRVRCQQRTRQQLRPASGNTSANTTNVSNVTLNIGDQAGSGAEALLTAAGLIGKLPFKAHWSDFTSGPPMLQAMGAGSIDVGGVGDAPPVFAAAGRQPDRRRQRAQG